MQGADALAVCCPLTDDTRGLVDGQVLDALRDGAVWGTELLDALRP